VLQAIYEFTPSAFPVFVGQQVDVFIAAPTREDATRNPTSGQVAFTAVADNRTRTAGAARRTAFAPGTNGNEAWDHRSDWWGCQPGE
jgi:hypothetical protein